MEKGELSKDELAGNNTLNSIIVRVDFLTIKVEEIIEKMLVKLGDDYIYNRIDNYDINFEISDPKKLITQDFIKQKIYLKNSFEFRSIKDNFRFVINQNFFLYERNNFAMYEGSTKDINLYIELLKYIFEVNPQIQRLGVRKSNILFVEQDVSRLKKITDNNFVKMLDENINQKFNLMYTPLEDNQKDGYNLNIQLDYGNLNINADEKKTFRYILDIDSYERDTEKINECEKIATEIQKLRSNNFELYKREMSNDFLKALSEKDKGKFENKMKNIGILYGANYGKHEDKI